MVDLRHGRPKRQRRQPWSRWCSKSEMLFKLITPARQRSNSLRPQDRRFESRSTQSARLPTSEAVRMRLSSITSGLDLTHGIVVPCVRSRPEVIKWRRKQACPTARGLLDHLRTVEDPQLLEGNATYCILVLSDAAAIMLRRRSERRKILGVSGLLRCGEMVR